MSEDQCLGATVFSLSGDQDTYDNDYFVVPVIQQSLDVVYIGEDDANDPTQMQYYLTRGMVESAGRSIQVRSLKPDDKVKWEFGKYP